MLTPTILAVAMAIASPAPSPAMQPSPLPSLSAPIASPAPTPSPTSAPVLGGVALGEDAKRVMRRLGLHPPGWGTNGQPGIQLRAFPSGCGDLTMGLAFDTIIHVIMVQGTHDPKGQCADPNGIRVGDQVDRLTTIRGKPDASEDDNDDLVVRYGPINGVSWRYKIHDTTIVQIELSDGI